MDINRRDELEALFQEELKKDEIEIDVEKLKRILDQLGEKVLTGEQKQSVAEVYKKIQKQLDEESNGSC